MNKFKKLLMMLGVVLLGASAWANVTVRWTSGALYTAASSDGGWSSTLVNSANALVTMNVYLVDAATYATVSAMGQKEIFDWSIGQTATSTGQNVSVTGKTINAVTVSAENFPVGTAYYSILTISYNDATYGCMAMATAINNTTPERDGQQSNNNLFGGPTGVKNWTSVNRLNWSFSQVKDNAGNDVAAGTTAYLVDAATYPKADAQEDLKFGAFDTTKTVGSAEIAVDATDGAHVMNKLFWADAGSHTYYTVILTGQEVGDSYALTSTQDVTLPTEGIVAVNFGELSSGDPRTSSITWNTVVWSWGKVTYSDSTTAYLTTTNAAGMRSFRVRIWNRRT